jgi:O-antigen/teichoic acid export membrane protein
MVIGASIGQVFYNRCATMVNEGKTIYPLIKKALLLLFLLSIPPFSLIFFFGEELFGFVFGETWRMSGKYSEIMSIWLMLNFIISPLSGIPMILKRQREYFFIGLMGTLIQLVGFAIIPFLFGKEINFEKILSFVSIGMVINHAIVIVLTLYFSRNSQKKIR